MFPNKVTVIRLRLDLVIFRLVEFWKRLMMVQIIIVLRIEQDEARTNCITFAKNILKSCLFLSKCL